MDLFKKTLGPVLKVMEDADKEKNEVDEIVLVGGEFSASSTSGCCQNTLLKFMQILGICSSVAIGILLRVGQRGGRDCARWR